MYISGDTNANSQLEPSETWTYTCKTKLTQTTTNTVFASGQVNGMTARDFAIATVVVAAPKLPNTGIASDAGNIPSNVILFSGILAILTIFLIARKKQTV